MLVKHYVSGTVQNDSVGEMLYTFNIFALFGMFLSFLISTKLLKNPFLK